MEMLYRELPNATVITISVHTAMERHHHRKIVLNRLCEQKYLFNAAPLCWLSDRPQSVEDSNGFIGPATLRRRKTD